MIIWGCGFINDEYAPIRTGDYMFSTYNLESTRKMLEFLKQGGAKVSLELMHSGLYGRFNGYNNCTQPFGPSECMRRDEMFVREMNQQDMNHIIEKFVEMAVEAKNMGFDMIMIHAAHGWLIHQFLSPKWNQRTDEYGGSIENRAKFPLQIIQAVRKAVGPEYPIDVRMNGYDWLDVNMTEDDIVYFAKEASKYVDMLHISAGSDAEIMGNVHMATTNLEKTRVNIKWGKIIKENVDIPVTVVGAIKTPEEAEWIISEGYADCVALGRELVADPLWVKKAYQNRSSDIVPCIRCLHCFNKATYRKNVGCSVNPRFNKEEQYPRIPLKEKRKEKVIIIGGGPAGMTAALTLKARGFEPILLEKTNQLGGLLKCTDYEEIKDDLRSFKNYLIRKIEELKIDVQLNFEATPENIRELNPDIILVGIGSSPVQLHIDGAHMPHVVQAIDIYPSLEKIGKKVTIIGGGTIGCEMALGLATRIDEIHIVELSNQLYRTANRLYAEALRQKLEKTKNIYVHLNTQCICINEKNIECIQNNQKFFIPSDNVILSAGMKSNREEANSFYGITQETYILGDCNKVGNVKDAVYDAYLLSMNL